MASMNVNKKYRNVCVFDINCPNHVHAKGTQSWFIISYVMYFDIRQYVAYALYDV